MSARLTRRAALGGLAALAGAPALGQGFAGLGQAAEGFAEVRRDRPLRFPADHGPHPDFRIEWWYVTANLRGDDGADYGVQWTLFRQALAPGDRGEGWETAQLWMGHAAATAATVHRAEERFARGGVGQAGVVQAEVGQAGVGQAGATGDPFEAWIDDWTLSGDADLRAVRLRAAGRGFAYDLDLRAAGPLVLHGDNGFSLKSERGQASHYYSQPHYGAQGSLTLDGRAVAVSGAGWLDREWSSQPLDPDQTGWDWFSLRLDSGEKVMLYRFRQSAGADAFAGTWIDAGGRARPLAKGDVTMAPTGFATVAGRETPVRWRLGVASRGFAVETAPLNPSSWNALTVAYWEGPVTAEGTHRATGYLEMTGY